MYSLQDQEQTRAVGLLFHLEDDEVLTDAVHRELLVLWEETLDAFAVDRVLVVDRTRNGLAADFRPKSGRLSWARFGSLQEAEAAHPDAVWVYLEQGGEPLDAFEHPKDDVIYAFGPDSTGFTLEPGKRYLEIRMPRPIGLFSLQAVTIVLYDRVSRRMR
ncbi:MAG TPA: hypothetical protein VGJ87_24100 [Roseiflexaceae bacterium]|jgi:hypothetical protein